MSVALTINPNQSVFLDRRVDRLDVNVGTALATNPADPQNPVFLGTDVTKDFDSVAGLTVHSTDGAAVTVYYFDEVKPEAVRGDAGGSGGSFESRTVTELRDLAKDRGLTVKGKGDKKPVKADFIKALRG